MITYILDISDEMKSLETKIKQKSKQLMKLKKEINEFRDIFHNLFKISSGNKHLKRYFISNKLPAVI